MQNQQRIPSSRALGLLPLDEHFLRCVDMSSPTGCWPWIGRVNIRGYGWMEKKGRYYSVHRLAWKLCFGKIPPEMQVLHTCHIKHCCQPSHLFLGTPSDQVLHGLKNKPRVPLDAYSYHLLHGNPKINEQDVRDIRQKHVQGMSCLRISKGYAIGKSQVSRIVNRKQWKFVK